MTEKPKSPPAGNRGANPNDGTSRATEATPNITSGPGLKSHYVNLTAGHAQELADSAISPAVARDRGVYSAQSRDELPEDARYLVDNHGNKVLPALVYPMEHPDGSKTWQLKPQPGSVTNEEGQQPKYIGPTKQNNPIKLPVLRQANSDVVLIVEGTKQGLSVLTHSPEDWSIYGIAGIHSWMNNGDPTEHLSVVDGKKVVVVPDADAKTNVRVYDGAQELGEACRSFGAKSVRYLRVPGVQEKDGIDDALARLASDDKRAASLRNWVSNAATTPANLSKPELNRMRADLRRQEELARVKKESGDRQVIDIEEDQLEVVVRLVSVLREQRGGETVFERGDRLVLVRRSGSGELRAEEMKRGVLQDELLQNFNPIKISDKDGVKCVLFPSALLGVVSNRCREFPTLTGITRSPVVRRDGTVVTTNGYDEQTGLMLDLTEDVVGIEVPEHPSDVDIAEARLLILDLVAMDGEDGYDGFPFQSTADQTHLVASMLTILLKPAVGCSPLFLLNGIQPGVGKGEAVDFVHRVTLGAEPTVTTASTSDAEMDKRLTALLLEGESTVVLDEVQDKQGRNRLVAPSINAFVTSEVYGGRKLGESEALRLPNHATVFGLGNNVQTPADLARRVLAIRLNSDRSDLENRNNFKYDLRTWVSKHRAEILRALLVLVRAWYDRGEPAAPKPFGFASFGEWQRVIGGILHLGGFEDFLGNVMEVRESADNEAVENREHLEWLAHHFGAKKFSASDVLAKARAEGEDSPAPYNHDFSDLTPKNLSTFYGQNPRWFGDLRIKSAGKVTGGRNAFRVERLGALDEDDDAPDDVLRPAAGVGSGEVIKYTDHKGFTKSVARVAGDMHGVTIAEMGGSSQ